MSGRARSLAGRRGSLTAAKVARGVAFVAENPLHAALLPRGAAAATRDLALASGVMKPWMVRLFRRPWYRRGLEKSVEWVGPGELLRLTLRKRYVEDRTRAALEDGAGQLLILGPGFDSLGPRLARDFPDALVIEVDTPATASRRNVGLRRSLGIPENLHVLGRDLEREALDGILLDRGWSPVVPSVVVAEGVLMYLDAEQIRALLATLRRVGQCGGSLVFTYLNEDEHGRPVIGHASGISRFFLRITGERLQWGIAGEDLAGFLAESGFSIEDAPGPAELARRYLEPLGAEDRVVGGLERLALARWSGR